MNITSVNIGLVKPGNNDRTVFTQAAIEELAASIKEYGLLQPPTVRPVAGGGYEIIAGERRYRAMKHLGWQEVPVIITDKDITEEEARIMMLVENTNRRDLDPIDEAKALQSRIDELGWTVKKLSEKTGLSPERIRKRLLLLELSEDLHPYIRKGVIPTGHAELMAGLDSYRQRMALRLFQGTRQPSIDDFRAYCAQLLAEQSQDTMFDLTQFWVQELEKPIETRRAKVETGLKVQRELPPFDFKRTGEGAPKNFAEAMLWYCQLLREQGFHSAANSIEHMLDGASKRYWIVLPNAPTNRGRKKAG